jgi:hypothetical protein
MPEPLIVGVPWNAISTLLRSNGSPFSLEGTFMENTGRPMGLPSSHKRTFMENGGSPKNGPSSFFGGHFCGNWRWSNWPYAFIRRTFLENEVVPMGLHLFWRALLWKLEVVQLTLCFHTKDLPGKWGGPNGPPFSQKGSSRKTQGAQKGLCFHKKGSFMENKKVLQFLSCTRVSHTNWNWQNHTQICKALLHFYFYFYVYYFYFLLG